MVDILLTSKPLNILNCFNFVNSPQAGGIDVFIGTVRDSTWGKKVVQLEFEAYEPMAISEMNKLAIQAMEKFPLQNVVIHHRTGLLSVGEIPVIIAVAAAHRAAAFDACRFLIDTLKQTVPIWKKEVFEDGEVWVAAHP